MFKKILLYIIIIYSLGNYFQFFSWYLGDSQMIIEDAFSLSLHSSLPMFLAMKEEEQDLIIKSIKEVTR